MKLFVLHALSLVSKSFLTCYLRFHFWSGDIKNGSKTLHLNHIPSWTQNASESELEKKAVATLLLMHTSATRVRNSVPCPLSRGFPPLPAHPAAEQEACGTLKSISACTEAACEQFPVALWFVLEPWKRRVLRMTQIFLLPSGLSWYASPAANHYSGHLYCKFSVFFLQSVL